jgi:hypothetical protein
VNGKTSQCDAAADLDTSTIPGVVMKASES